MAWYDDPSSNPGVGSQASGVGLLTSYGVSGVDAQLAMQSLFKAPYDMDPAMGSYRILAKAAQTGLRAKKYITITPDGILSPSGPTVRSLSMILGPDWEAKDWYHILDAIRTAKVYSPPNPLDPTDPGNAQPGMLGGLLDNPLLLIGGGVAAYYLFFKKGR